MPQQAGTTHTFVLADQNAEFNIPRDYYGNDADSTMRLYVTDAHISWSAAATDKEAIVMLYTNDIEHKNRILWIERAYDRNPSRSSSAIDLGVNGAAVARWPMYIGEYDAHSRPRFSVTLLQNMHDMLQYGASRKESGVSWIKISFLITLS